LDGLPVLQELAMSCPCGEPLHYSDPVVKAQVTRLVEKLGEHVPITTVDGTWLVSRHYIALHGVKADELPGLGFAQVFLCPRCGMMSAHPNDIAQGYCGACHDWTRRS
jgi:hypothetical protein